MQFGGDQSRRNSTSERLKPAPVLTRPVTFHYEIQNHTTRMQKLTRAFQVYRLMAWTVICVLAGIAIGLGCRRKARHWNERHFMYIELPGELYLRFLKLMIIPLLVSNVILSFGTIQGKISSKLAKVAGALYLASNLVAIVVAIVVATVIAPGAANRPSVGPARGPQLPPAEGHLMATDYRELSSGNLREYRDSIARYREYHPMFYHTNLEDARRSVGGALGRPEPTTGRHSEDSNRTRAELGRRPQRVVLGTRLHMRDTGPSGPPPEEARAADLAAVQLVQLVKSSEGPAGAGLLREGARGGLSTKLPIDVVLDVLRNLVPDSLVGATLQQSRTCLFAPSQLRIDKSGGPEPAPNKWLMGHETVGQPNIIGLLAVSVLTGVVLSHMGEAGKPLLDLCSCVSELSLRVGMEATHAAPFCIMFLLIGQIARARDLSLIAGELLMYVATVAAALAIHGFLFLPLAFYLVTKKSPLRFFKGLLQALVASFATSSSSATMALVLDCLSELEVNLIIVRAFGPLGSVFNMNGTSIFEAVAVIFIAQTLGVRLPVASLLLIGLCSAIASLSTSGIPSSGMMTMVIVLNAINLPVLELSLIYIVDFIIDRFRTVINVWSGAVVCGLIDHICPEELFEEEMKTDKYREMVKFRGSRSSLSSRKGSHAEDKPQVISVTITPPPNETGAGVS